MVTLEEFSRVTTEVYASSLRPENWPTALARIDRAVSATGCAIFVGAGAGRSLLAATVPPEARDCYQSYYHSMDYVLDAVETGPAGLVHSGRALVPLAADSEFDVDFMRPFHLDDGLFARLGVGGTPVTFLAAAAKGAAPFATADRAKFIGALVPHLQQALLAQRHLRELGTRAGEIRGLMETIRHGVVIVGPECVVLHMNSAAERILATGDGLTVRGHTLEATGTTWGGQLQRSIGYACVQQPGDVRRGDAFACRRPSGKRPYIVHVLPLSFTELNSSTTALVTVIDTETDPAPPRVLLRRLFGLANAEADVALRVLRGGGLKPISEDLSVSTATLKTHLAHIFDKTGTHRQAELVRLLLAVSP
ncbi:LuxR family transcriptional regulator [Mycolicibacterium chitae]|uniref:DNA-binding protein with HTH domain n=1 Tax=Mycolicibacterium chitae TaxID=1792 RepID=A0A448HXS8_MYCCI|nr:LuxR C-terminal-related transcriptional regulator [Mycolicibacterium chitae]MCV7106522.1 LuxR family transcriptional regulator [Mycolicibacterium chitae]BBZ02438.1 LuxR family transcriptional regulator [Mycolicibacterium chitae]VEG45000.1 DNA-binding protein with HTH domain [Mycolicibacterium chitae]